MVKNIIKRYRRQETEIKNNKSSIVETVNVVKKTKSSKTTNVNKNNTDENIKENE